MESCGKIFKIESISIVNIDSKVLTPTINMPFETKHFNANQQVFIRRFTGFNDILCFGKYRGSGRFMSAWVKLSNKELDINFKYIEVSTAFYNKIMNKNKPI